MDRGGLGVFAALPVPDSEAALMTHPRPATVGQLKETGYRPMSVKDEIRRNLIRKLKAGEELFPGIIGYRDSVIPQIINGILIARTTCCSLACAARPKRASCGCCRICWTNGCPC